METIQLTIRDKIAVIALNRGRSNPINAEMVAELATAIKDIENNDAIGGLIITGKKGFFSAGVDLMEVYHYNHEQSRDFWSSFLSLQTNLATFKKPLVAAITGHSPAGGCIIALCSDYRIMAKGEFVIGLNEIPVGIIVPDAVFHLYAFWLGKRNAYQYLMEGKLLNVDEALRDGLIDEAVDPEEIMAIAAQKLQFYLKFNTETWQQSKLNLRKELLEHMQKDQTEVLDKMLKQWWSPEIRLTLQTAIEKLQSSSAKTKSI